MTKIFFILFILFSSQLFADNEFVGKKFYPVRGKKIDKIIDQIKENTFFNTTLGNCVINKVNNTIIVSKEH